MNAAMFIFPANSLSFSSSGVLFPVSSKAFLVVFPISVLSPTAITLASPFPFSTIVPRNRRLGAKPDPEYGSSRGYLETALDSPVNEASETLRSVEEYNRRSAGTSSPADRITISSTTK